MALTLPVRFSATILDSLNVQATCTAYLMVDPTVSFSTINTLFNTFLTDLDNCIDGQILGAAYHVTPGLPGGLKSSPVSGSRCEQTGVLNFMATGDTHRWGFAIPALSSGSTVINGGVIVISSGSPVNTLFTLMLATSSSAEWSNANSQLLSSFRDCLISFRQRNQRLARTSIVYE